MNFQMNRLMASRVVFLITLPIAMSMDMVVTICGAWQWTLRPFLVMMVKGAVLALCATRKKIAEFKDFVLLVGTCQVLMNGISCILLRENVQSI